MKTAAVALAYVLIALFDVIHAIPHSAIDAPISNLHLQKREPHPTSLPSAGISKDYTHGETGDCLEIKIPATLWQDAGILETEISWFTLKLSVQVSVDVQALGFLRNGCSFENTRNSLNGCRFDGDLSTNEQGHRNEAYLIGTPGTTFRGCFSDPLQAASVVTPISFGLGYFVKWYDPAEDGS